MTGLHSTTDALLAQIAAATEPFSSELAGAHANRSPMAQITLARLGAPASLVEAFDRDYRREHPPVALDAPRDDLDRATWADRLGRRDREADLRAFFHREIAADGLARMLETYLPRLAPGIAASFFIPLMRLSYAVGRGDPGEAARALGYWAATFLPLPPHGRAVPSAESPLDLLRTASRIEGLDTLPPTDLLWRRIEQVASLPGFAPAVDSLALDADAPRRIAATVLELFAATGDFRAMYAVSAGWWLRTLAPFCAKADLVLGPFWRAIAALLVPVEADPDSARLDALRRQPAPDWAAIAAAATRSADVHHLAFVLAAREEDQIYGDPLYRLTAARCLGLVDG